MCSLKPHRNEMGITRSDHVRDHWLSKTNYCSIGFIIHFSNLPTKSRMKYLRQNLIQYSSFDWIDSCDRNFTGFLICIACPQTWTYLVNISYVIWMQSTSFNSTIMPHSLIWLERLVQERKEEKIEKKKTDDLCFGDLPNFHMLGAWDHALRRWKFGFYIELHL